MVQLKFEEIITFFQNPSKKTNKNKSLFLQNKLNQTRIKCNVLIYESKETKRDISIYKISTNKNGNIKHYYQA